MITVDGYYVQLRQILDLLSTARPYGIPLVPIFVGNASEHTRNQMKVDGYCVPNREHGIDNKVQEGQLVASKQKMTQDYMVLATILDISEGNPRTHTGVRTTIIFLLEPIEIDTITEQIRYPRAKKLKQRWK